MTRPFMVRGISSAFGASVITVTVFFSVLPPLPLVDTLMVTDPSSPGGMGPGTEAAVHPQVVLTLRTFKTASPWFRTTKSCTTD